MIGPDTASDTAAKARIVDAVDGLADRLLGVSHEIHANPELAFGEHHACRTLSQAAGRMGLTVAKGVYGLDTSFEARFGDPSGPTVAILAEYDALPDIGHACGHNIIAAAALGAAAALHVLASELPGQVVLLGTPAEESGGGKELMARAGCFEGVDAALMIHPCGHNAAAMPTICFARVRALYRGKSAHASAMPHDGVNALDALVLSYQAIAALRQHIRPTERIHGIITDGGTAPNVIPDRAAGDFYVRAASVSDLAALKMRVASCFEGGALATGCEVELDWSDVDYLDLRTSWPLANVFQSHAEALGRIFVPRADLGCMGAASTDMGNVSHRVPSIHPMLKCAPADVVVHHPDFTHWAASELGDAAVLDGAKAMALTVHDYLSSPSLRDRVREAFELTGEAA